MASTGSEMGRARAAFGFLIGGATALAGVALRTWSLFESPESLKSVPLVWAALALAVAAVMAAWLARPRSDLWIDFGLLPVAGALALVMPLLGWMEAKTAWAFVPAALEAAGAFTLTLSAIRWARADALRRVPFASISKKQKVHLVREGQKKRPEVPAASLVVGDEVELASGDVVPVDGTIVRGSGFVDETPLVGDALPAAKKVGDPIFAGTVPSIVDLALRTDAPLEASLLTRREESARSLLSEVARANGKERVAAGLTVLLGLVVIGLIFRLTPFDEIEVWLPLVAAAALAVGAAPPVLALQLARLRSFSAVRRHGLFVTRAKDMVALTQTRRWQIDPMLLAAPGEVECIALGDVPADVLIAVAEALLSQERGPEHRTLGAAIDKKKLERLSGAAFKRNNGVAYATVNGDRWFIGPEGAVSAEEELTVEPQMVAPIGFLRDKGLITLLIGKPGAGLLGVLGIGVAAESDAKAAAVALGATVMPGLPDATRKVVAAAAGITCDGPPAGKRDVTILAEESERPSAGLRIRVVPPGAGLSMSEGGPRILAPSLPKLGDLPADVIVAERGATIRAISLAIAPAALAAALMYFGFLFPATGGAIGLAAVVLGSSRAAPDAE